MKKAWLLSALTAVFALHAAAQQAPRKVLNLAFNTAETTFDPAAVSDIYSRAITGHIFESLYTYDPLARPAKVVPLTATAMPDASADFRTWTVRIQPGIRFAEDPAFGGKPRELVAQDYVYSFARIADPASKSSSWSEIESYGMLGLAERRREALDRKQPFDYTRPFEGVRALDRYTIEFRLAEPRPRFVELLAATDLYGAVAREVVEKYGDAVGEHPVGTGPFRIKQWRRSSLIVLERNPGYRERVYDAQPGPDDAEGQAVLAQLKGRRLPMIDEVRVSIVEEEQPRWLSFLNRQIDALATTTGSVPQSFLGSAMPGGKLAPNLAKMGIKAYRQTNPDSSLVYYNMEDPVVGGYTPDKIALRRALNLAQNVQREITLIRRGQAIPAQSPVVPGTIGYDPNFKSENGDYDPARANALLDMYGYVDKDGDGWRDLPDGKPLLLDYNTQPDQIYRQFNELFKKDMEKIGVRVRFITAQWPEQLKQARAGKLMIWSLGSSADKPDGQGAFERWYGPQSGSQNLARFKLPAFDAVYDQLSALTDGPEREAKFREAKMLAVAYAPYKIVVHRISTDMVHPWIIGYRRPVFWLDWWHTVDLDAAMRAKALAP